MTSVPRTICPSRLLERWRMLKRTKNFVEADRLRNEIRSRGEEPNDWLDEQMKKDAKKAEKEAKVLMKKSKTMICSES